MKVDLEALTSRRFDLLVIGGGILGACTARDAALRGLDVALVEREDFASGTSSNSLKILHGGLRYLQHLDFVRMRTSIRERSMWLRIAPHLVEPLPILVPCFGDASAECWLFRLGLAANDLVSWDRNADLPSGRHIPGGRAVSKREALDLAPVLDGSAVSGGVLFWDAQMYSSERLVLELIEAAYRAGASVANYVQFESARIQASRIVGAKVRNLMGGEVLEVRCRAIVNATGPALPGVAARICHDQTRPGPSYSVALNLMVDHLPQDVAFSLTSRAPSPTSPLKVSKRWLFVVPWRARSIIGTAHFATPTVRLTREDRRSLVRLFLKEVNCAWPGRPFEEEGIRLVHLGFLPSRSRGEGTDVRLRKRPLILDHTREGCSGAYSAATVKYTAGRRVAEMLVNRVCDFLGRRATCRTASTPLPGAPDCPMEDLAAQARSRHQGRIALDVLGHLVRSYGSRYEDVIAYGAKEDRYLARVEPSSPVIRAQLRFGVEHEMARTRTDLLLRRTELGTRGEASGRARAAADEVLRDALATVDESFGSPGYATEPS